MGMYQIKDIEYLSGIKAHTLRIWEKRYNIVEPKRTSTNIRFYDDSDLKRILNISILNKYGYKISKIAKLPNQKLNSEILSLSVESENLDIQINNLIKAMVDFDKISFEKIFHKSITDIGFQNTILEVIHPFFKRIGILWLTENIDPAQEHFISNIVRQKLIVAIDGLPEITNSYTENFVLFLPDGQWHEMGLLMSNYLIKKHGYNYVYLGSSLPFESVLKLNNVIAFNNIVTTISFSKSKQEVEEEILSLASEFSDKLIFIGGVHDNMQIKELPNNVHFTQNLVVFDQYLQGLK